MNRLCGVFDTLIYQYFINQIMSFFTPKARYVYGISPSPTATTHKSYVASPRITSLEKKANIIRELIVIENDICEKEELFGALSKVNMEIQKIVNEPLKHDLCKDKPWALECKVFDL